MGSVIWIAIVAVVSVVCMMFSMRRAREMRESSNDFLAKHPDAARVYLSTRAFITSEAVEIYSVNGDKPESFMEKGKTGFLVLPGTCTVEIRYCYTRPGILHKNVTETTDLVKKELATEAKKSYLLGFDRGEKVFTFVEYDPESK